MRRAATSGELLNPISIHMGFCIIILQNKNDSAASIKGMINNSIVLFLILHKQKENKPA